MKENLIDILAPRSGSKVLICDVHASESGALAILNDLYNQIRAYEDKTVTWVMVVSTPQYRPTENIIVERYPWVKKSWGHRCYFDVVTIRKIIRKYHPHQVLSLQNHGIPFKSGRQTVYLQQALFLTDHPMDIQRDGVKLWVYQNVMSRGVFRSLRKADTTVVQTRWMKDALIAKTGISPDRIVIQQPDISCNGIGTYEDTPENRKRLFYPAIGVTYKNHGTLLMALKYAQDRGLRDYELVLTVKPEENRYTRRLFAYAQQHGLRVVFGGQIPREQVFEMYTRSTLVFPSYIESFGMPLLEARMTGSPVIASDVSFSREILAGYEKASFFAERDAAALGELILASAVGKTV